MTERRSDGGRVIGIDAGGTKTLGVLMDDRQAVITRAQSGGSNVRSVGIDAAERNLGEVLSALLAHGGVRVVCIGAAGVGRADDYQQFLTLVRKHVPAETFVDLRSDAQIILRAATPQRPAMVVIAGTGSVVYGESDQGSVRAGGYGAVIGDPGSGYAIGLAALRATAEAVDEGVASEDILSRSVLSALQAASVDDIIGRVHRWPPDVALIASFSKLVAAAYVAGDPGARRIVTRAGEQLARLFRIVERRIRTEARLPVVLSGGAFDVIPELAGALQEQAASAGPCDFFRLGVEPVQGAALIALDILGQRAAPPQ